MAKEADRGLHLLACPTPTSNDLRSLGHDLPSLCPGWRTHVGLDAEVAQASKAHGQSSYEPGICTAS